MSILMTKPKDRPIVSFSLPQELLDRIDSERGLITRSAYLVDLLSRHYNITKGARK